MIDNEIVINEAYMNQLEFYFGTSADLMDFSNAQEAADKVNNFVNFTTDGLINSIVKSSSFSEATKMVLVNAIYFKANWKYPFDEKLTGFMNFRTNPDKYFRFRHGMKMNTDQLSYAKYNIKDLKAEILALPYADENFRMLLILPETHIEDLNLDKLNFNSLDVNLQKKKIDLTLPKFKIDFSQSLVDPLERMNVSSIFHSANFKHIAPHEGLKVTDIFHRAMVEVSEEGSEAAAATAVQLDIRRGDGYNSPIVLNFDKPFYFIIQDMKHKIPLFMGRIVDPSGLRKLETKIN